MFFYAISAVVNALTSIILAVLIFLQDMRSRQNLMFALFALSVAGWSVGYFFWQIVLDPGEALFWVQVLMAFTIFIPVFYFHFVLLFLNIAKQKRRWMSWGYLTAIVLSFANAAGLLVESVSSKLSFPFWPNPGHFFDLFLAIWIFYVVYSTYLLVREYQITSGTRKKQIEYILIGTIIGYLGGITNFLLWYDIPIPPVGNIFVSFYVIMVAYAIVKHRLFNIKVIATEFLVFVLWGFLLIRLFISEDTREQIINGILLAGTVLVGILLIRSVGFEVEAREKLEKLSKELKIANTRLKELDQRKSEFLSLASHQLRTPLTAIKGYASMLVEGAFGSLPSRPLDAISRIFESSKRLVSVVDDFLTISRIEQNKLEYDFQSVDFEEIVHVIVNEMTLSAKMKGLRLIFNTEGETCCVMVDTGKMKQVLGNLIDNAIKYTPKGTIKVTIRHNPKDNIVRFAVSDSGVGMSQETIDLIFKKFSRARDASKVNTNGSGLGLYIAHRIVKEHSGRIWAESEGVGKGSTFLVELPLDTPKE